MNEKKVTKEHVKFLYEGLKVFYPFYFYPPEETIQPIISHYKRIERKRFTKYVLDLTDTFDVGDAIKVLLFWLEPEVTPTLPPEIAEMVESLQEQETKTDETKQKTLEDQIDALRERLSSENRVPKPEGVSVEPPAPKAEKIPEEVSQVGINIPSQSVNTLGSFLSRVALSPAKLLISLGGHGYAQDEPGRATALFLMSRGVTGSQLIKAKTLAQSQGIFLSDAKLKALANFLEEQKYFSPFGIPFYKLTQRSYTSNVSFSQAEVSRLTLAWQPGADSYSIPRGSLAGGILGSLAQGFLGRLFSGLLKGFSKKAAGKAAAHATAQAAVAAVPGAGIVVSVLIEIGSKILGKIKDLISKLPEFLTGEKNKELRWVAFGALFFGGIYFIQSGFLLLGAPLVTAGGLGALGELAMSAKGLAKGGAGFAQSILTGFTAVILPAIGTPAIIALVSIPIIIGFILLIINAGAYIVPPGELLISESPYIKVDKKANPSEPFKNEQIPFSVEFTITITAKKGRLENIRIDYDCKVIKEAGSPPCPEIEPPLPKPGDDNYPTFISPLESYEIKYSVEYDSPRFNDSAVIDTITVTADAPEQKDARASGSAAVIIGTPPTACFIFDDDWPADARAKEIAAIADMGRAKTFMAQLCGQGEILLDHEPQVERWGGWAKGYKHIVIYPLGVLNHQTAVYTLAHESGHILSQVTSLYSKYLDTPGLSSERPICTYPVTAHPASEDFAETVALYYSKTLGPVTSRFSCLGGQTFKTKYPNHWEFARNSIFLDNLDW